MRIRMLMVFLFWAAGIYAQTESVKIRRAEQYFYRGTTAELRNWILVVEEGQYFLFNVALQDREVQDWFNRFRDSQNIYKSSEINPLTIVFEKENGSADRLTFYYIRPSDGLIDLTLITTMQVFRFREVLF